jgi:integrase
MPAQCGAIKNSNTFTRVESKGATIMAKKRHGDALYLRGESWYMDAHIGGVRYQKKLGKHITRSVAQELAQLQRAAILKGELGVRKKKDIPFDDASAKFLTWCAANRKHGTTQSYKECLLRLAATFAGKRLSQISSFHVEAHKQARIKAGAKVRANRELAVLKTLFNLCRGWQLFDGPNPVATVKFTKEPRQRLRFLEPEEEARLLAVAPEPLRTIILVGIYCGLRLKSEALTLKWQDIDLGRRTLTVLAAFAKTGNTRSVPLHSLVVAALERLPRRGERVFTRHDGRPYRTLYKGFTSACRKAGLVDVTPHTLRHTFASRLLASGVDPIMATRLGGWSSIKMLDRYAHADPSRMAEAIERLATTTGFTTPEKLRIVETA